VVTGLTVDFLRNDKRENQGLSLFIMYIVYCGGLRDKYDKMPEKSRCWGMGLSALSISLLGFPGSITGCVFRMGGVKLFWGAFNRKKPNANFNGKNFTLSEKTT